MDSIITILLISTILLVVQHPTNAINCYRCELGTDGCGAQSFNRDGSGVFTTDDSSATYCMKTVYSNNQNAAIRSYSVSGVCGSSVVANFAGVNVTTMCCTTDLCNSAYIRTASTILVVIFATIGVLLLK